MFAPIYNLLDSLRLGEPQHSDSLVIFPILGEPLDPRTYLSLSEGIAAGTLTVGELSHGGSVPELLVHNSGELPVLMIDGEELSGAKQNRVLNASILVAANGKLVVPVSCSEAGRWSYRSPQFGDSGEVAASSVRHHKSRSVGESLKSSSSYLSDQGMVWSRISDLHRRTETASPSAAMRDVYEGHRKTIESRLISFPPAQNQCGIVVVVDGHVRGLDFVSDPFAYLHVHEKLVRSYVVDLLDRSVTAIRAKDEADSSVWSKAATVAAVSFVTDLKTTGETIFESPGLGKDHRLQGKHNFGSALVWDGSVVHLVAFPGDGHLSELPKERMAGWRQRMGR